MSQPEVTAYEELGDGTIRLSVEAVWIREMEDCVLPVSLTVRPLEDGDISMCPGRTFPGEEMVAEGGIRRG